MTDDEQGGLFFDVDWTPSPRVGPPTFTLPPETLERLSGLLEELRESFRKLAVVTFGTDAVVLNSANPFIPAPEPDLSGWQPSEADPFVPGEEPRGEIPSMGHHGFHGVLEEVTEGDLAVTVRDDLKRELLDTLRFHGISQLQFELEAQVRGPGYEGWSEPLLEELEREGKVARGEHELDQFWRLSAEGVNHRPQDEVEAMLPPFSYPLKPYILASSDVMLSFPQLPPDALIMSQMDPGSFEPADRYVGFSCQHHADQFEAPLHDGRVISWRHVLCEHGPQPVVAVSKYEISDGR